jgi:hypothetical protein
MWPIKKLQIYAGLLTFVNLTVYGIVGLSASYLVESHNFGAHRFYAVLLTFCR